MKIIYKSYILLCLNVLFLQSCSICLLSKQSENEKKHCFLQSHTLEDCNILINNLINRHTEVQQFMIDTCDYSLVFIRGNSIVYFFINHNSCSCYGNNKIENKQLILENILLIEYLASLKIAHIQKKDNSTLIFSNELPLLVLIKKNGILSYCFMSFPGCNLFMDSDDIMIVNKIDSIINNISLLCTPHAPK